MSGPRFQPQTTVTKEYLNLDNGEVLTMQTKEPAKARHIRATHATEDFIMVFQDALISYIDYLPGQRMALVLLLAGRMDQRTGHSYFSLQELADELETPTTYVSKMIRELIDVGILTRIRRGAVAVNPLLAWRGSLNARREHLKQAALTDLDRKAGR